MRTKWVLLLLKMAIRTKNKITTVHDHIMEKTMSKFKSHQIRTIEKVEKIMYLVPLVMLNRRETKDIIGGGCFIGI